MNRVTDSPIPKTGLEWEISQQLDKISETGDKLREQILELGKKLKSFQAEDQTIQEPQVQSSSAIPDWIKSIEAKKQEMAKSQQEMDKDIRELEKQRLKLQEVMAEKFEDVLKDVTMLKSLTETTMELKPQLDEERKITRDLESQVEKMTRDLKEKLDLLESARKNNHNSVKSSMEKFGVPASMLNDSDGWIVIQKRDSGPRDDFERDWTEYENGFGSVDGNFWLGLKKIHELTADGSMELRIELTDWDGKFAYAEYSKFTVGNDADLYRLSVSGYSGTAGDSLHHENGIQFSTKEKIARGSNATVKGGWWRNTNNVNLNGLYYDEKETKATAGHTYDGVYWWAWKSRDCSLQKVMMKIRNRK